MTKYQTSPIPASSLKGGLAILKNISHLCPATKQVYDATRALKEEAFAVVMGKMGQVKINPDSIQVFAGGKEVKSKAVVNYKTGEVEVQLPKLTGEEIQLVATPPNPKQHKTPKNLKINPPKA